MADVFRKAALERLSSPEQLDKVITVSKPVSWLALLGLVIGVTALVIWSFLGSLPTTLPAPGIVSGGEGGQIVECYVPYAYKEEIKTDLKAVVKSGDKRHDAKVVEISDDGTKIPVEGTEISTDRMEIPDKELTLGSEKIFISVKVRLASGTLPERSLVNVQLITEETKPITKLFPGLKG